MREPAIPSTLNDLHDPRTGIDGCEPEDVPADFTSVYNGNLRQPMG